MEFIYKNFVFILTCLNFNHLQSTLFNAIHLSRYFFQCSKQCLNSSILMPFSASVVFCFTSSTSATHFPSRIFSSRETKNSHSGSDQVNREGGVQGHAICGQKLLSTQHCVGRCAPRSPIMKWANVLKESSNKYSLKLNTASHNNTSWYTDRDGFLEHTASGEACSTRGLIVFCPPEDNSSFGGRSSLI